MVAYRSSTDRLIGDTGIIIEPIPGDRLGRGVIKVGGQLWSAESDWPESLAVGTRVLIVGRSGLILRVLPES